MLNLQRRIKIKNGGDGCIHGQHGTSPDSPQSPTAVVSGVPSPVPSPEVTTGSNSDQVEIAGGAQCQISSSNCLNLNWGLTQAAQGRTRNTKLSIAIVQVCKNVTIRSFYT